MGSVPLAEDEWTDCGVRDSCDQRWCSSVNGRVDLMRDRIAEIVAAIEPPGAEAVRAGSARSFAALRMTQKTSSLRCHSEPLRRRISTDAPAAGARSANDARYLPRSRSKIIPAAERTDKWL